MNHVCDYDVQANALLSSVIKYDDTSPLLFRDETNDNISNLYPLSYYKSLLLDTLQGLSTANIINVLNNNQSAKKLTCKDAVMLLRNYQLDGGSNKSITNNLDSF